jgi:NADPH:quinone reductase-like Zn-dependent oxidoreductase
MKAMLFREFGGPEVLHFEEIATPEPGPGEILVKVHYVTVNVTLDVLLRSGRYYHRPPLPHILGCDPVGEVVKVGSSVKESLKPGTRVMVHVSIPSDKNKPGKEADDPGHSTMIGIHRWGAYAEYVCVPDTNAFALPDNLSDRDATVILRHLPTARHQLHAVAKLKRGEWVLVMGAAGGLASCVIQVAKIMGAKVIGAAGSDDRVKTGLEFGADYGINYRSQDLIEEVKKLTGGLGVHVVAENVGDGELFPKALKCLRNRGRLVTAGAHATGQATIDLRHFYLNRIRMIGEPGCDFPDIEWAIAQCAAGKIKAPLVDKVMGLSEAPEAHRLIEARAVGGKILLDATQ